MHYYIDGYNLLFRILRAGDDIRRQREEITLDLERKISLLELEATLVFDSHYQEDESTRSHFKSLEIIFTAKGETADEFILHKLKESTNPTHYIVVTSDKKLARLCQLRLAKTESVEEFLAWVGKRCKNKMRQKRLEANPPSTLIKAPPNLKKVEPVYTPTSTDPAESCFNYYLDSFQKELQQQEQQKPSLPKKAPQEPKKPKVKKQPLTKEEEHLSDLERWQKAFEKQPDQDP